MRVGTQPGSTALLTTSGHGSGEGGDEELAVGVRAAVAPVDVDAGASAAVQPAAQVDEPARSPHERRQQVGRDDVDGQHPRVVVDAGVVDDGEDVADGVDRVGG